VRAEANAAHPTICASACARYREAAYGKPCPSRAWGPGGLNLNEPEPTTRPMTTRISPGTLALALASLSEVEFRLGDWQAAYASAIEALRLAHSGGRSEDTGQAMAHLALVEAGLGREEACRAHGEQALAIASRQASHSRTVLARAALGLLELGLGRLDAAVAWPEPLSESPAYAVGVWASDYAEALVPRGDRERAADALAWLARGAARTRTFAVQRALDRCRGLLWPGPRPIASAPVGARSRACSRVAAAQRGRCAASHLLRRPWRGARCTPLAVQGRGTPSGLGQDGTPAEPLLEGPCTSPARPLQALSRWWLT
jgi:hypothetical protein